LIKKLFSSIKKILHQSSYFKWIITYTTPYLPSLILLITLNSALSLTSIGSSLISKHILDNAEMGSSIINNIILYFIVVLIIQILTLFSSIMTAVINEKFSYSIRKQIYDKILTSYWSDVTRFHTGDLMTRMTSDANTVATGIASVFPSIITFILELVSTFFVLNYFDSSLAIFALILGPFTSFVSVWLGKKLKSLSLKVQESESKYRSYLQESLSNLMIIKTFLNEQHATEHLDTLQNERMHWILKKNKITALSYSLMGLGFEAGYVVAFAWGSLKISQNAIGFGTMTVFLNLVNRIQSPLLGLSNTIPKIVSILASTGRIIELQNIPLEAYNESTLTKKGIGVNISDLTFGYTKEPILTSSNLEIRPNEFVAIVGESGIGKTTLIRLIMSFLHSDSGNITFYDETGSREQTGRGSREFISYVPQGNTLFSGTIRDNVLMGNMNATETEILDALTAASAMEFIHSLPDDLDTVIGEKGYGLSEGQAQRIAIARALIRKAPFLILDEATSSLDEGTELSVLEGIRAITPRPTCLIITHRKSVLAYCDREIVIENKQIGEVSLQSAV